MGIELGRTRLSFTFTSECIFTIYNYEKSGAELDLTYRRYFQCSPRKKNNTTNYILKKEFNMSQYTLAHPNACLINYVNCFEYITCHS